MRNVLGNTLIVYNFEELVWGVKLRLIYEKFPELKDKEYIGPLAMENIGKYYEDVEFYADGTVYEEI